MGNFVIERKSQDSAMKFKMVVRINGGEKIELMPGQRKEIELVDGVYNIVASLNMQKKSLNIEMPQENKVLISYEVDGVHIESLNKPKEYDLGATSAPTVENIVIENKTSSETKSEASVSNDRATTFEDGELRRIEIICPHCKSNQVTKTKELQIAYYALCFVVFAIVATVINSPLAHWAFGIISVGALVLTILSVVANKKVKQRNVWIIVCDTCGKNFEYPIPSADSKEIITNLKTKE